MGTRSERKATRTVAFRLTEAEYTKITAVAAGRGLSAGEFARTATQDMAEGTVLQELLDAARETNGLMAQCLEALARATEVLLVDAGSAEPAEAQQWVTAKLRGLAPHAAGERGA